MSQSFWDGFAPDEQDAIAQQHIDAIRDRQAAFRARTGRDYTVLDLEAYIAECAAEDRDSRDAE